MLQRKASLDEIKNLEAQIENELAAGSLDAFVRTSNGRAVRLQDLHAQRLDDFIIDVAPKAARPPA